MYSIQVCTGSTLQSYKKAVYAKLNLNICVFTQRYTNFKHRKGSGYKKIWQSKCQRYFEE